MSVETEVAMCVLSTAGAGVACMAAMGTGGLGAAGCAIGIGMASVECYEAGQALAESEIDDRPDFIQMPPPPEPIDPQGMLDPGANRDASWNLLYEAGARHLAIYNRSVSLTVSSRSINKGFTYQAFPSALFGVRSPPIDKATKKATLVKLTDDWEKWIDEVRRIRFPTPADVDLVLPSLEAANKFVALRPVFNAMDK